MFVTHDKFGDTDQIGAIPRIQEINHYEPEVLRYFCKYFNALGQDRSVVPKESVVMMAFFDVCYHSDIQVTDKYIAAIAKVMTSKFNGDLSPTGTFWQKAKIVYDAWHKDTFDESDADAKARSYFKKESVNGTTFVIATLNKYLGLPVPEFEAEWKIEEGDI